MSTNPESARLEEAGTLETFRAQQGSGPGKKPWRKWGPYLSERQWGTVREDYSQDGNAWDYFTHDQARSRAYHWGEDGMAGISDDQQLLCFSVALWNGKDPILKERMFGLTNSEANHGEDVKEYYFYLDSTPTHSYMKYLYKYPQAAFPYSNLIETNKRRNRGDMEYELLDTGVFNEDRYFDVFVEYAKQSPEDLLIQISVSNRGPEAGHIRCPADPMVSQHLDMVARYTQTVLEAESLAGRAYRLLQRHTPIWVSGICTAREMSRCCSRKMRPTTSGSSARPTPLRTSKMGSTTTWFKEITTRSTPRKRELNLRHTIS